MIKRKTKICRKCKQPKYLFSKGLCQSCHKVEFPYKIKTYEKPKKVSEREKGRMEQYVELRYIYLKKNPICEVCKIQKAIEIHHKSGRAGEALYSDFLAVCHGCHVWIEEHPEEAKEKGYSISRIKRKENAGSSGK